MFERVLIANRGEIAIRIARTLHRLGCSPATVYAPQDAAELHVSCCDVAVEVGSYLDAAAIVAAATGCGAQAVHPGYGFLSERAELARGCIAAGLAWIGPPPATIELMGDKAAAKQAAESAGLPIVPGLHGAGLLDRDIEEFAQTAGLPILVKGSAGGGGRGIRIVRSPDELKPALVGARREALAAFGDDALLVERYVSPARHIEVQVLADAHGTILDLGERECSLQRRHQKVIEESPSPAIDAALRTRLGEEAVALARSCEYVGAGTVEFVVEADAPQHHYFLEMNTRLQVEHAVTEVLRGIDLVEWQLRIALGEQLRPLPPPHGHAVEARIYAEDPASGFLPASGRLLALALPSGDGVRVDAGVRQGDLISTRYDPMVAKLIVHAPDRDAALERLRAALAETVLLGVRSNVGFLLQLLADEHVLAGRLDTELLERMGTDQGSDPSRAALVAAIAQSVRDRDGQRDADPFVSLEGWRISGSSGLTRRRLTVDGGHEIELALGSLRLAPMAALVDGVTRAVALVAVELLDGVQHLRVDIDGVTEAWSAAAEGDSWWVGCGGRAWRVSSKERPRAATDDAELELRAPMPGVVVAVHAREGAAVVRGGVVVVIESMKMELQIVAPRDGTLVGLRVAVGDQVALNTVLASVVSADREEVT